MRKTQRRWRRQRRSCAPAPGRWRVGQSGPTSTAWTPPGRRVAVALARRIPELPGTDLEDALEPSFRIRVLTYAARQVAGSALVATGARTAERPARAALQTTEQLAVEHASARSIWLRNSVRGAVGLALC